MTTKKQTLILLLVSALLIFAALLGLVPQDSYIPIESVSETQLEALTQNTIFRKHWVSVEPESYEVLSTTPMWTEYQGALDFEEPTSTYYYPIQIHNSNGEIYVIALAISNKEPIFDYVNGTKEIQGVLKDVPEKQIDAFNAATAEQNSHPYCIYEWGNKTTYEPVTSMILLALGIAMLGITIIGTRNAENGRKVKSYDSK